MWDHIINIYLSELLNTKTKESKKMNRKKKKMLHNKKKNKNNLHFISNNILINFFKKINKI